MTSKQKAMECLELARKAENKTTFFGSKNPDFETALVNYTEASNILKSLKEYSLAVEATLKVAETHKAMNALFMAAKALETAANMVQLNLNQLKESAQIFQQASDLYMSNGSSDRSADCLEKSAKNLESIDPSKAIECYQACLDLIEQGDSLRSGVDSFKRAISFAVKIQKLDFAILFSNRLVQIYIKIDQKHYLNRQALSTLLLYLIKKEPENAKKCYTEYSSNINGFAVSEDGKFWLDLMECQEKQEWENLKKSNTIKYLDNQILKLFLELETHDVRLESQETKDLQRDLQNEIEEKGFL